MSRLISRRSCGSRETVEVPAPVRDPKSLPDHFDDITDVANEWHESRWCDVLMALGIKQRA